MIKSLFILGLKNTCIQSLDHDPFVVFSHVHSLTQSFANQNSLWSHYIHNQLSTCCNHLSVSHNHLSVSILYIHNQLSISHNHLSVSHNHLSVRFNHLSVSHNHLPFNILLGHIIYTINCQSATIICQSVFPWVVSSLLLPQPVKKKKKGNKAN